MPSYKTVFLPYIIVRTYDSNTINFNKAFEPNPRKSLWFRWECRTVHFGQILGSQRKQFKLCIVRIYPWQHQ